MRNIGDKVWVASMENYAESITCLECFGKKKITVILGDDSKFEIPCAGCSSASGSSTGFMQHYQYRPKVEERIMTGIEQRLNQETEYIADCSVWVESRVFDTKEEAEKEAQELVVEYNNQEKEKIYRKRTDTRTWAWHVYYYRSQIREAEKTIALAKEKLGIALIKSKEKE